MSVRFFKIFLGVLAAHFILLNLIWVGFLAPLPRPAAAFIYAGALPAQDTGHGVQESWGFTGNFKIPGGISWVKFRDPAKPLAYDHLGL